MRIYFISIIVAFSLGIFTGATFSGESNDSHTTYTQEDVNDIREDMEREHEEEIESERRKYEEELEEEIEYIKEVYEEDRYFEENYE